MLPEGSSIDDLLEGADIMTNIVYLLVLVVLPAPTSACLGDDLRDAVRHGNVDRVKSLLESGADANTSYENGYTPIYFADDPKIVDLLITHGAKLNVRVRSSGQSPIEEAAEQYDLVPEHRDTWRIIVARLRDAGAVYTIDTAIYMKDVPFVAKSLAADASWVNKRRGAQHVPLRLAARTGRVEICKRLLEHGADPNAFEEGVGYPIMVDAVKHPAVVKLLIEHRANLRRRITWHGGRSGQWIIGDEASALHFAVQEGSLESVKLLIAAGLDPNGADDQGQTPLHIAVMFSVMKPEQDRHLRQLNGLGGQPEKETYHFDQIVAVLLENDASVSFVNRSGKTPLWSWPRS
jgi:Ankyrin repeats (many copies)/Ankyrin repeat